VFEFFRQQDLAKIHEASMRIIEMNGMVFHSMEVLDILKKHGVKIQGKKAYFQPHQVLDWVKKAPGSFKIVGRNPECQMVIGGDFVECAPGFGSSFVKEADGTMRQALVKDYLEFLKLFHQSSFFKINGGILVQPSDIDLDYSLSLMLYATLTHSDKCLLSGTGYKEQIENVMDMMAIVFGGRQELRKTPRMAAVINVNSPMQFDRTQLETMMVFINNGQPVAINSGMAAGNSGPVTMAGAIALGNAEVLVGVAVAQMIREGAMVMYGLPVAQATDMRCAGTAIGGPETSIGTIYGAGLAKMYGLPTRGCGSPVDSKAAMSVQSGYEAMMLFLSNSLAKVNLLVHSAGVMDSYLSMSYEMFMVNLEIIGMVKHLFDGVTISDETLALELIQKVGPGGNFLAEEHTFKHCRSEVFNPDISLRGALSGDPGAEIKQRINRKRKQMLEEYEKPGMPNDIRNELAKRLESWGVSDGLIKELS